MDLHIVNVRAVLLQHQMWGRDPSGRGGVRRRQPDTCGRMLVVLHGGVRLHMHRGRVRGGGGYVRGNVRGRDHVVLCGGMRRREYGGRGRVLERMHGGGRMDELRAVVRRIYHLTCVWGRPCERGRGVRRRELLVV